MRDDLNQDLKARLAKIVRVMESQRRIMIDSGADEDLIRLYAAVVRRVARFDASDIRTLYGTKSSRQTAQPLPPIMDLSLDEIERLNADKSTPRRTLEAIAVHRFDVPRGSMRSFSNVDLLRAKIQTRIDNERTHGAIRSMAGKGGSRRP